MDFFRGRRLQNGLLDPMREVWVFLDWAKLDQLICPSVLHLQYLGALKTMIEICRILKEDAGPYERDAAALEETILRFFWSEERGVFVNGYDPKRRRPTRGISQQAHALAILLGLKPEFHRRWAETILLPPMKAAPLASKNIVEASPFFYYYVLSALLAVGGFDAEIVGFIRRRWGAMLESGATTCHEIWNTIPVCASLCHAWAAHPVVFLTNILAGLTPVQPNWSEFALKPGLLHLDRLLIRIPAGRGYVALEARKENGRVAGRLSVPAGVAGEMLLPGARKRVGPGVHRFAYREEER